MTKQKLKDYRYTCKCIKQIESELKRKAAERKAMRGAKTNE